MNMFRQTIQLKALIYSLSLSFTTLITPALFDYQAEAKRPRKSKKPPISQSLRGLKWGMGHLEIFTFLEKQIKTNYDKQIDGLLDDIKIDSLRADQRKEIKKMKANYVTFTGQRTGYEVSLLKDDFSHNNSETMLKYEEGSRQRFYFFRYDKLWKIMVVYPSAGVGVTFKEFIDQIRSKYGRPKKINWETPYGGSRMMVEAIWQDAETQLVLEDKSSFYGRFVMRFLSVIEGKEIQGIHSKKRSAKKEPPNDGKRRFNKVDIFSEEEGNGSVVDRITGTTHKVNMNRIKEPPPEE